MQENHGCELRVKSRVIWAFEKLSNNIRDLLKENHGCELHVKSRVI